MPNTEQVLAPESSSSIFSDMWVLRDDGGVISDHVVSYTEGTKLFFCPKWHVHLIPQVTYLPDYFQVVLLK